MNPFLLKMNRRDRRFKYPDHHICTYRPRHLRFIVIVGQDSQESDFSVRKHGHRPSGSTRRTRTHPSSKPWPWNVPDDLRHCWTQAGNFC